MSAASTMAPAVNPAPQHMRALQRANEIRLARAALKREIAAGRAEAAEVVLRCPPEAHSMTVTELLAAQRRWGKARARKLLSGLNLRENKPLGTLTERQRGVLVRELAERSVARNGLG